MASYEQSGGEMKMAYEAWLSAKMKRSSEMALVIETHYQRGISWQRPGISRSGNGESGGEA